MVHGCLALRCRPFAPHPRLRRCHQHYHHMPNRRRERAVVWDQRVAPHGEAQPNGGFRGEQRRPRKEKERKNLIRFWMVFCAKPLRLQPIGLREKRRKKIVRSWMIFCVEPLRLQPIDLREKRRKKIVRFWMTFCTKPLRPIDLDPPPIDLDPHGRLGKAMRARLEVAGGQLGMRRGAVTLGKAVTIRRLRLGRDRSGAPQASEKIRRRRAPTMMRSGLGLDLVAQVTTPSKMNRIISVGSHQSAKLWDGCRPSNAIAIAQGKCNCCCERSLADRTHKPSRECTRCPRWRLTCVGGERGEGRLRRCLCYSRQCRCLFSSWQGCVRCLRLGFSRCLRLGFSR